jgi:hypothetical protein
MGQIIKFACLTGLRPAEAVESVRLINASVEQRHNNEKPPQRAYFNPERQALEHFRFPEIFFRQTKKAYISFITHEMLVEVTDIGKQIPTYNDIR